MGQIRQDPRSAQLQLDLRHDVPSALAGGLHGLLRIVLFFLVAAHFAGAIYGQFVQNSGVIGRMMKSAD